MRGSVLKRSKTWSYVLYLGRDNDGKKRQKWVGGFRTRKDAEGALSEAWNGSAPAPGPTRAAIPSASSWRTG
jgi:hypothetical protein